MTVWEVGISQHGEARFHPPPRYAMPSVNLNGYYHYAFQTRSHTTQMTQSPPSPHLLLT